MNVDHQVCRLLVLAALAIAAPLLRRKPPAAAIATGIGAARTVPHGKPASGCEREGTAVRRDADRLLLLRSEKLRPGGQALRPNRGAIR